MGLQINELYAWVAVDEDGDEGVMSFYSPQLQAHMPMVGADFPRVDSMREIARRLARDGGVECELRKFTAMTVVEKVEL